MIEDRGDLGPHVLQKQTENLIRQATAGKASTPGPGRALFSVFRANVPQLHIEPDPRECMAKRRQPRRTSPTRCRSTRARCTSTTSTCFGRTWQVIVQADAAFRDQPEDLSPAEGPQQPAAAWCRSARWPSMQRGQRAAGADALQHVPGRRRSTAAPRPGVSSGEAIDHHAAAGRRGAAAGHGLRVDRDVLPGAAGRQHGHDHLRLRRGHGVPGAGGAVRELVAAAGRHPGRADVPAQRDHRREHRRTWTSTSSRRSASWCWSAWPARTPS